MPRLGALPVHLVRVRRLLSWLLQSQRLDAEALQTRLAEGHTLVPSSP